MIGVKGESALPVRLGTCALVSAFGSVVMMPSIQVWKDVNLLWWLFFVLAAGIATGGGKDPLFGFQRAIVAAVPAGCELIYIGFQFALGHAFGLSGLYPDNPRFWIIVLFLLLLTWGFTYLFSYCRQLVAELIRWVSDSQSVTQVERVSKVISAVIGLIGVIGLLIKAVGFQ
jgi:hypothetical protein